MTVVPFAEYRPDVASLNSQFTADVENVLCAAASYIPFPSMVALTSALEAVPLGAFLAKDLAGQVYFFVGTDEKLFILNNTTLAWDDVSKAATTYGATSTAKWSFAQFGEYVVAVNQNDDPQVFQVGTSTTFDDLGGSPPRAGIVKAWGDFLVLLQLTSNPNRAQWSALNDIGSWTPGTNNSDYQDFPDGGVVQGSNEATNPIIFLERSIYFGTFIPGSVEIFSFQKVHEKRGAKSAYSVATRGAFAFYADEGGFFQISPDGQVLNIGFEKVDRTVFGQLAASDAGQILGAVDPFFSRVYWAADYAGTGIYDTILVYDWNLQRWSVASDNVQLIFPAALPGYTLEGLDAISASIDALPFSLDAKAWQGGAPVLAAFNSANELCLFNGANKEATITTAESGDPTGGVTLIQHCQPIVDTDDLTVAIGSRFRRNDAVTWTSAASPSSNTGRIRKMARARFHRFRTTIAAGASWTHAEGIDVAGKPAGSR